jgi:hypothetical protein
MAADRASEPPQPLPGGGRGRGRLEPLLPTGKKSGRPPTWSKR